MKILSVVGARPNFMKIAPICEEMMKRGISHTLVHTGQHYDLKMSRLFFEELAIPRPDVDLGVGSGTQARQTAEIMQRLEPVLEKEKPDVVIVVGDVNSTMAAAITAAKLNIPVAHVESGLRSFDRAMPEEINRLLTDAIADYHFTTEESANDNLIREGVAPERIFFVGNTMIDTLRKHVVRSSCSTVLENIGVEAGNYGVITLHRPSNVDNRSELRDVLEALKEIASELPLVFPVHPRTRKRIEEFGLGHLVSSVSSNRLVEQIDQTASTGIILTEPMGYLDFLKLMKEARIVFTDSGGIQEETTVLKVPCVTLRNNTERPVTVTLGTNVLVGSDRGKIVMEGKKRLREYSGDHSIPPLWDGLAAGRIVDILIERLSG